MLTLLDSLRCPHINLSNLKAAPAGTLQNFEVAAYYICETRMQPTSVVTFRNAEVNSFFRFTLHISFWRSAGFEIAWSVESGS